LKTLQLLFKDWSSFQVQKFPLKEKQVIEVATKYNKIVHSNFQSKDLRLPAERNFAILVGLNVYKPVSNMLLVKEIKTYRPGTFDAYKSSALGYELNLGAKSRSFLKGASIELGYGYFPVSNIYKNIPQTITTNQYVEHDQIKQNTLSFRVNYAFFASKKFTPYFSIGLNHTYIGYAFKGVNTNTLNGTTSILIDLDKSVSTTAAFVTGGISYALNRQHLIRLEFDNVLSNSSRPFGSIIRCGYQFAL
jgi:opacity protein-like surface antigen